MKSERHPDDLWTQRTLSTFQTFARGQDQKGGQQHPSSLSSTATAPGITLPASGIPAPSHSPSSFNGSNGINGSKYLEVGVGNGGGLPLNGNSTHSYHHYNQHQHHPHHHQRNHWNDSPPPPPPPLPLDGAVNGNGNCHASLSPTSSSSSGGDGSPKDSITSHGSSSIFRYIENNNKHHKGNNVSITHVNCGGGMANGDIIDGNGQTNNGSDYHNQYHPHPHPHHHHHHGQSNNNSNKKIKPVNDSKTFIQKPMMPMPVAVPKLHPSSSNNSNRSSVNSISRPATANHNRSRSIEGHHQHYDNQLPNGNLLVLPPPSFSAPYASSFDSNSLPYHHHQMDTGPIGYYMPSADDEQILQVTCAMTGDDKRFGFSVIGGREEGFPPCIDEITPDKKMTSSIILDLNKSFV